MKLINGTQAKAKHLLCCVVLCCVTNYKNDKHFVIEITVIKPTLGFISIKDFQISGHLVSFCTGSF